MMGGYAGAQYVRVPFAQVGVGIGIACSRARNL
jgi:hypothetical protein